MLAGYSWHSARTPGGLIGNLAHIGLLGIDPTTVRPKFPSLFETFQLGFAIVTAALICGAIADRARFSAWMIYLSCGPWRSMHPSRIGFGARRLAGDRWAPSTTRAAGRRDRVRFVCMALALVLGPRIGFKSEAMRPHNLPFVLLGVGLLWFGWFGFNAGWRSPRTARHPWSFLNTLIAGCLGMLGWIFVERFVTADRRHSVRPRRVVAGLVAITPSCGFVSPIGAFVVGLAAGVVCSYAVGWKFRAGYDDSLDVVGVHFVGGVVGTFLIGLLAAEVVSVVRGFFFPGGPSLASRLSIVCSFFFFFFSLEGHRHPFFFPPRDEVWVFPPAGTPHPGGCVPRRRRGLFPGGFFSPSPPGKSGGLVFGPARACATACPRRRRATRWTSASSGRHRSRGSGRRRR